MLRRSLILSMLFASATCVADEVPAGEPMASATASGPAQGRSVPSESARTDPAQGRSVPSESARTDPTQRNGAKDGKGDGDKTEGGGDKTLSGMSILGNQEAPKSLVIVPWKSSELGDTLGLAESLDDSRRPVDKEVFMRELSYYEIRSTSK
jgi:hypothetical protein